MIDRAITFSLIEWLSVTGMVQSVWILVYIALRVRQWRQALLSIAYFTVLTAAFALQFALRLEDYADDIRFALWAAWAAMPSLCYLLVLQISRLVDLPPPRHFLILLALPVAIALSFFLVWAGEVPCGGGVWGCGAALDIFNWGGAAVGGLCLLALWGQRDIFSTLWSNKSGRERYWLVMMLLVMNILAQVVSFLRSGKYLSTGDADALLVVLGMSFSYLATTTLFRVYPAPVQLNAVPRGYKAPLNAEEERIGRDIRRLMDLEKLYQEPSFSRADLARELSTSESMVSKVINSVFDCSFPRLVNQYRVEDAKLMLRDPLLPIQTVAFEAGFNSLASFNRVFREVAGVTPSAYRTQHDKKDTEKS